MNAATRRQKRDRRRRAGFSLVEMLMVIVAMAIFAGIIIPQIGDSVGDAKQSTVLSDLHELTAAIERYRIEHNSQTPDDLTGGSLLQLTEPTDVRGAIGSGDTYPLGPYILEIPVNPFTQSAKVEQTLTSPPVSYQTSAGWLYHVDSGQVWPAANPSL